MHSEVTTDHGKALAIMAHDIKAPLSAIVSMLEVINKGYVEDMDKIKELVTRATTKAETLITAVDDILDYTLLANKSEVKREDINLCDVLGECISTVKSYAAERGITITVKEETKKSRAIFGNYTFLVRALNNIVMNAVKYNRDNGTITIDCSENKEKNTVTVIVSDTGIGIPKDDLDKVFKIFERGRFARRNINGSLGLGLSLVKQIIEDHYGRIEVASTVGVGTTFSITLPLKKVISKVTGN